MLFSPVGDVEYFSLYLWKRVEQGQQGQGQQGNADSDKEKEMKSNSAIIVSVYEVADTANCSSSENVLISTTVMNVGDSSPVYKTATQHSSIKITPSSKSPLYLIKLSA